MAQMPIFVVDGFFITKGYLEKLKHALQRKEIEAVIIRYLRLASISPAHPDSFVKLNYRLNKRIEHIFHKLLSYLELNESGPGFHGITRVDV
jgi:hypothetical protein